MTENDASSTTVSRAIETLRVALTDIGWDPQRDEETAGFVVEFDPPYIPVAQAFAAVSADMEIFVFYLNFGVATADDRKSEIAKFLTLANFNLMNGNFEMDYEDGLIRFRSGVCFQGTELSGALIRNVILFAMNTVEHYAEGVIDVVARGKSAEQAFQEASASADADENETGEEAGKQPR
jgi:hypothetical protein